MYDTSKLKPFDLERAKAGDPICQADGKPARLLSSDINSEYPLAVALTTVEGIECVAVYKKGGELYGQVATSTLDLRMAPKARTAYVNIYPFGGALWYATEEEAQTAAGTDSKALAVAVPITIEE